MLPQTFHDRDRTAHTILSIRNTFVVWSPCIVHDTVCASDTTMRRIGKTLIAAAVLLAPGFTAEAQGKPEIIEPPQGEIIEEVVNEGGELKPKESVSPPSAEAYVILLLKEEMEGMGMKPWKKGLLEAAVGLGAGFSLGMVGGYIGARSTTGTGDPAFAASLAGTGVGAALGSIPSVYFSGRYLVNEKGSFWGTFIGGIAGTLVGAALSYPSKDFTIPIFVVPVVSSAGAVLGSRYLMVPRNL